MSIFDDFKKSSTQRKTGSVSRDFGTLSKMIRAPLLMILSDSIRYYSGSWGTIAHELPSSLYGEIGESWSVDQLLQVFEITMKGEIVESDKVIIYLLNFICEHDAAPEGFPDKLSVVFNKSDSPYLMDTRTWPYKIKEKPIAAQNQTAEQNEGTGFNAEETEDEWEPLPIERGSEKLVEAINSLTAAIEAIREDNGYAANKPDERKAVLLEAEAGKKALEEQEQVFKFQIRNLVHALKKAAKTFISTTISGGKIASALNAIINLAKNWLG